MGRKRTVRAGGGILVRRHHGTTELLLIHRRGHWDLPKGKAKPDESIRDCAEREVCEELGIRGVRVLESLGTTRHGYREDGLDINKTTWWFLMRTDATAFVPQASEGIDAVRWVRPDEAIGLLGFDTLRELVGRHLDLLSEPPA